MENNSFKIIKTVDSHIPAVSYMSLLMDGRLAICSDNKKIFLYCIHSDFSFYLDLILKGHTDRVMNLIQVDITHIISISHNEIIFWFLSASLYKIDHIIKKNTVNKFIRCICVLTNNRLAMGGFDLFVSIYSRVPPYKLIAKLKGQKARTDSMIQLRNKEILISCSYFDGTLFVWSLQTYQCVANIKIKNVANKVIELDNDRLAITSTDKLVIISSITYQVIQSYEGNLNFSYSLVKSRNGNLLWGTQLGRVFLYDIRTNKAVRISEDCDEEDTVWGLVRLDYTHFAVGVGGKRVFVWEY